MSRSGSGLTQSPTNRQSRSASCETGVVETVGWAYGLEIEAKDRDRTFKDGSKVKERRYPAENFGI